MKPNKIIFLSILTFFLLSFSLSNATIRYVSKTGSSTPPYTSWATAADSIQKCIDICDFGDTIYVANGVYEEEVVMIAGLSLIGAGTDSCIIDTRNFFEPQAVGVNSDCLLKNFKIIVQNSSQSYGTGIVIGKPNSVIEFNDILNAGAEGIWCYNTDSIIRHNRILYCYWGLQIDFNQPVIDSNYIYIDSQAGRGITLSLNSFPIIRGNIVVINNYSADGIRRVFNWSAFIANNNIYAYPSNNGSQLGIYSVNDTLSNNVVLGKWEYGIFTSSSDIRNNHIEKTETALRYDAGGSLPVFQFNNLWRNQNNFQNFSADTTNIYLDPMFVNEDSMNLHIQKYSPLIDAGDPAILDKDSTRSDIGLYGGPYGESYIYLDLPPRQPVNFTAQVDSNIINLNWNRNTEADFNHYNLYRDTVMNFTFDSTKLVVSIDDTFYLHLIPANVESLYFKLTAVDNQGNESNPSEEVSVILVSVKDEWQAVNNYMLYQNYPNPFNPSTKIGYKLKERGYVKLYVYDIKGEFVEVLVNQVQEAGYYEVEFFGRNLINQIPTNELASGIYIYQIMVKNDNNIPVFSDIKKMVYIK